MVMYRQHEDLEFLGTVARDERGRLMVTEYGGTAKPTMVPSTSGASASISTLTPNASSTSGTDATSSSGNPSQGLTSGENGGILRYRSFYTEKKLQKYLKDHLHQYEGFTAEMYVERATELLNIPLDDIDILGFALKVALFFVTMLLMQTWR